MKKVKFENNLSDLIKKPCECQGCSAFAQPAVSGQGIGCKIKLYEARQVEETRYRQYCSTFGEFNCDECKEFRCSLCFKNPKCYYCLRIY